MGKATATLNIGAALKGGTKSTFKAISKGLRDISLEVKRAAKDLLKMGDVSASNALGSLSMVFDNVAGQAKELSKGIKDVGKSAKDSTSPLKGMEKSVKAVSEVWAHYEKTSNTSLESTKANESHVRKLSSSIGEMARRLNAVGADGDKWAKSLKGANLLLAERNGQLQLNSKGMKIYDDEGRRLLGIDDSLKKSLSAMTKDQRVYQQQLQKGAELIGNRYIRAVKSLGKSTGYNNEQTKVWSKVLTSVNNAVERSTTSLGSMNKKTAQNVRQAKLASITQQVLAGNIKTTSTGLQILNEKGLVPFKKLTYSAAKSAGMLSKGFAQLSVKEGTARLTELGKAYESASARGLGFKKGLDELSKSGIGVSSAFKTRIDAVKKIDDTWRKYTDHLQASGAKSMKTLHQMNNGFNAFSLYSKKGADGIKDWTSNIDRAMGKSTPLSKVMDSLAANTGIARKEIEKYSAGLKDSSKNEGEVSAKLANVNRDIINQQRELSVLQKKRVALTGESISAVKKESQENVSNAKSVKGLQDAMDKQIEAQKKTISSSEKMVDARKRAASAKRTLNAMYPELLKNSKEYRKALGEMAKAYKVNKETGEVARKELMKYAKNLSDGLNPVSMFKRGIDSIFRSVKNFASYAAGASIVAGIAMSFRSATTAVIDFDQSLKDLQAITGATDREVEVMGEKILSVASTTKFSAEEVALGMKTLGQAGLSAAESVQTMQAVADLATGTLTDMGVSVDLVTTAMRVFDISSTDSGHVADVFANAVNRSKLTVEKLRIAMNYVGPVAKRAGVSFEEVASSMMVLANSGIRASTIGTGLRQVFRKLVDPSKKLSKGIRDAGLSLDDFNPQAHSMSTIIQNLSEVVVTAEDAFQMFGMRGASAISALTESGVMGFDKMFESVNRAGAAAKMAEIQMEGLGVKIKNMWDKTKNLAIAMGDTGLASILGWVVDRLRDFLDIMVKLTRNPITALIVQITAVTTAFAIFFALLKSIASFKSVGLFFTNFKGFFTGIPGNIAKATMSLSGFIYGTDAATASTNAFTASLWRSAVAFAANPWGLAVIAIAALVTAFVALITIEKRHYRQVQKQIDESRNLIDKYKEQEQAIKGYRESLVKAGDDVKKVNAINLDLRRKLEGVSKAADDATDAQKRLASAASFATNTINPLTGAIDDGSYSIGRYNRLIQETRVEELGRSFKLVADRMDEQKDIASQLWDITKRNTKIIWEQIKASFSLKNAMIAMIPIVGKLSTGYRLLFKPILDRFPRVKKMFEYLGKKASSLLSDLGEITNSDFGGRIDIQNDYKEGDVEYRDYSEIVKSWTGDLTKDQIKLQSELADTETEASHTIQTLFELGRISMGSTSDELIDATSKLKGFENMTKTMKDSLIEMFRVQKEGAAENSSSTIERWALEYEKATKAGEDYSIAYVKENCRIKGSLAELDQARINSWDNERNAVVEKFSHSKRLWLDGKKSDASFLKEKAEYENKVRSLNTRARDDESLSKAKQLVEAQKWFTKERKQIEVNEDGIKALTIKDKVDLIHLEEKFDKRKKEIMAGTYDTEAMTTKMREFTAKEKQLLTQRLRDIDLASTNDRKGTDEGIYERQRLDAITSSNRALEAESYRNYQVLLKSKGKLDKGTQEAHKKYLNNLRKGQKSELDSIKNFVSERNKYSDKVSSYSGKRTDELKKHSSKWEAIEKDTAAKILSINTKKEEKIKGLIESRTDAERKASSDIEGIHQSADDKIADIKQRGMSDKQKERDNENRAYAKFVKGKEQLRKAVASKDKDLANRAKASFEAAGGLYEGLSKDKKAIRGIRNVEDALVGVTNSIKDIDISEIDKDISKEEGTARRKIRLATDLASKKKNLENQRHERVMANLDAEIAKWNKKLAVAKELLAIAQKKAVDNSPEFIPVANASTTSDNAPTPTKIYKDDNGVYQNSPVTNQTQESGIEQELRNAQALEDAWIAADKEAKNYGMTVGEMADYYANKMISQMDEIKAKVENGEKIDIPLELGNLAELQAKYSEFAGTLDSSLIIDEEAMGDELQGVYLDFIKYMQDQDSSSVSVEIDKESLKAADSAIKELAQTVTVLIKTKESHQNGGQVGAISRAKGGRIPGPDSKKDNTLVHARTGEWFIRNESVKVWKDKLGSWFMNAVNSPMSSSGKYLMDMMNPKTTIPVPKIQGASLAPSISSSKKSETSDDFGTVNLNLPNKEKSIPVIMKSQDVSDLLTQIKQMERFAT